MIEKYPSVNSTDETGRVPERPCADGLCVSAISRLLSDKDKLLAATTALEGKLADSTELPIDRPKASTVLEMYDMDKGAKEYTFIGRFDA